jgi:S-methylmethionine-dependent homocysteine/selenocysteine methylase
MTKYRHRLPQLGPAVFLTDGGLETTLIFHDGVDLPYFAAFDLLKNDDGRATLRRYFDRYADIAKVRGNGLVLETPTWRANPDWAAKLGYDAGSLAVANRRAVDLLLDVRRDHETAATPIVISGNLGPRGDGYVADKRMSAAEAADYHGAQVATFAQSDADMVAAFTMNYVEEAIGVVRAAQANAMPVAISFTLETDGRLPSGMPLVEAIDVTDDATGGAPAYYMINCAHPTHFDRVVRDDVRLRERLRGLRANASKRSHAELDASPDLDEGDPVELGAQYRALRTHLPNLTIVGGCCGTDHRHVDAVGAALVA